MRKWLQESCDQSGLVERLDIFGAAVDLDSTLGNRELAGTEQRISCLGHFPHRVQGVHRETALSLDVVEGRR